MKDNSNNSVKSQKIDVGEYKQIIQLLLGEKGIEKFNEAYKNAFREIVHSEFAKQNLADFNEIVSVTESASIKIFDTLESLIKLIDDSKNFEQKKKAQDLITEITEQLSFQDLIGQRAKRVKKDFEILLIFTYIFLKEHAGNIDGLENYMYSKKNNLMFGPQSSSNKSAATQDEINTLFP